MTFEEMYKETLKELNRVRGLYRKLFSSFIKDITIEQTGGGVVNDIIELKNGFTVVLTLDAIYIFSSVRSYEDQEEPLHTESC